MNTLLEVGISGKFSPHQVDLFLETGTTHWAALLTFKLDMPQNWSEEGKKKTAVFLRKNAQKCLFSQPLFTSRITLI